MIYVIKAKYFFVLLNSRIHFLKNYFDVNKLLGAFASSSFTQFSTFYDVFLNAFFWPIMDFWRKMYCFFIPWPNLPAQVSAQVNKT